MGDLLIHQFPCRSDNYGVLIHDEAHGLTAAIDTPSADSVRTALGEKGWKLTHIFTTHHHHDHTEGHAPLKAETGCTIVGAKADAARIPGIDVQLSEGDRYQFGAHDVQILETPGHTSGHISYWIAQAKVAFVGDTLFALGCGRLFEGTPAMMWGSLKKLMALPGDTAIYCGHEYTQSNAAFALTIEPQNAALQARAKDIAEMRAAGRPTVPTNIAIELETNPFLRPSSAAIRTNLSMQGATDEQVFAEVRARKDRA